jgi:hypothetical protein
MKPSAWCGDSATSTWGCAAHVPHPSPASTRNHSTVTGPNQRPTLAVPKRCTMNSAVSTSSDSGTTQRCSAGAATSRPSTAPSTDTAGVMTPSPKKIAVPKMPSSSRRRAARAVLHRLRGQRQHGDQAAFAVVVGTQDQHHVLERRPRRQRPEHQRQDAQDVVGRQRHAAVGEHLLQRIQRAGADVAVDDADGGQRRRRQGLGVAWREGGVQGRSGRRPAVVVSRRSRPRGRWPRVRRPPPAWPGGRSRRTCRSGSARWPPA